MYLGLVKLAAAPVCFVYLKSGEQWHSDVAATGKCNIFSACRMLLHQQLQAGNSNLSYCVGMSLQAHVHTLCVCFAKYWYQLQHA